MHVLLDGPSSGGMQLSYTPMLPVTKLMVNFQYHNLNLRVDNQPAGFFPLITNVHNNLMHFNFVVSVQYILLLVGIWTLVLDTEVHLL